MYYDSLFHRRMGRPCPQEFGDDRKAGRGSTGFHKTTGEKDDWVCSVCGVPSFCPWRRPEAERGRIRAEYCNCFVNTVIIL